MTDEEAARARDAVNRTDLAIAVERSSADGGLKFDVSIQSLDKRFVNVPAVIAVLPPAVSLVGDHEGCEPIGDGTGWRCVLDPYMELHDGSLPLSSSVRTLEFETTGETAGATIEFQAVSFGNDVLNDPHPENNIARMPLDER